jgi:hypothetical protein
VLNGSNHSLNLIRASKSYYLNLFLISLSELQLKRNISWGNMLNHHVANVTNSLVSKVSRKGRIKIVSIFFCLMVYEPFYFTGILEHRGANMRSQVSSVGIVSRLRAGRPGVRFPAGV